MDEFERYARQTLLSGIGQDGQRRLHDARVGLVGCGALGTWAASLLARAGVGYLRIIDRDYVELTNLQRQVLFTEADCAAGLPKAAAAAAHLREANSQVQVEPVVAHLSWSNAEGLLHDLDLVVDGTDNFETRYVVNDVCVKLGKPWVYGGAVGTEGMVMAVVPGQTACLRCLFPEPAPPGALPTCDTVGVFGPVVGMVASLQSAEALKLIVDPAAVRGGLVTMDPWQRGFDALPDIPRSPDCPACGQGRFDFLEGEQAPCTVSLCGRGAVQVLPAPGARVDLDTIAQRLSSSVQLARNSFLLRFHLEQYELTIFPDARAIIKGTTDEGTALNLYARYVGY